MNIYEILPNESPVLVATINYTQTSSIYTNSFFTIHGGNNTVVVTMLHVGKIDGIARYQGYTQSFAKASVNSFILSFSEELDAINFLGNQVMSGKHIDMTKIMLQKVVQLLMYIHTCTIELICG